MKLPRLILFSAISLAFVYAGALAQDSTPTINSRTSLNESGETTVDGRTHSIPHPPAAGKFVSRSARCGRRTPWISAAA